MEAQTLSLVEILKVGGLAGVVSALFSAIIKEWFESRERRRKGMSFGIQLADILENYYYVCSSDIYELRNFKTSRGHAGQNKVGLPDIAEYPSKMEAWGYIPHELTDRLLRFRRLVEFTEEGIRCQLDVNYDPEGPDPNYSLEGLYKVALTAAELAKDMRKRLSLPPNHDLDVAKLRTQQAELSRLIEERHSRPDFSI